MDDIAIWAALATIPRMSLGHFEKLEAHFGGISDAWEGSQDDLVGAGLSRRRAAAVRAKRREVDLDSMMEDLDRFEVELINARSADYPSLLLEMFNPPPVLYVKGSLRPEDGEGIAIVGTRRSTRYGETMCDQIAGGIASANITVVSGLARGIDTAAHRAAIDIGGRTVAVLGGGIGHVYPRENRGLAAEISEQGAVISEYPLRSRPHQKHFPMRNRIVVGLSRGVVVVEAPRESGIQRTVKWALESNREVFAVPGQLDSETSLGTNAFLKQGATMATCARDVVSALSLHYPEAESKLDASEGLGVSGGVRSSRDVGSDAVIGRETAANEGSVVDASVVGGLNDEESAISRFLAKSGLAHSVDEVARECDLPAQAVNTALTMLQVRRLVTCLEGTMFRIVGGRSRGAFAT